MSNRTITVMDRDVLLGLRPEIAGVDKWASIRSEYHCGGTYDNHDRMRYNQVVKAIEWIQVLESELL